MTHQDDPAVRPFFDRATALRPTQELYRITDDPYDMKNLAFDPAFKTVLNKMDAQLTAELKASHDPRIEGRGALFDHYPTYNDPGFKRPDVI